MHILSTRSSILALLMVALLTGGCTEANHGWGNAYCEDDNCFSCDEEGCQPLEFTACGSQTECGADETCTNLGCVMNCKATEDCWGGLQCNDGFCVPLDFPTIVPLNLPLPTSCNADEDCTADMFCSDQGSCAPKCKSDDECGPDQECLPCGKCQDKGTSTPATCGTAPKYCSTESSCGEGKQCLDQRCHFECQNSSSCPIGQVCSGGLCMDDVEPAHPECSLDIHCSGGMCINGYCHGRCETSADCSGVGLLCQMGACRADYNPAN